MEDLFQMRKKLNISLREFSKFLDISYQHVSFIESGQRTLNGAELFYASNMQNLLMARELDPESKDYSDADEILALRAWLQSKIVNLEHFLNKRNDDLKKMLVNYKNICFAIPYYRHIDANLLFMDREQREWFWKNKKNQEKLLISNGLQAQLRLKFRIKSIQDEMEFYREVLGNSI